MKETREKEVCPVCEGSGMDYPRILAHEEECHEIADIFCNNCWFGWLLSQREADKKMTVEKIPLSEVDDPWGMQESGYYGRSDGAFFGMVGVKVTTEKREVKKGWSQPILEEFGKGVVALVKSKTEEGNPVFLLTARQEPGNPGNKNYIMIGSTIQASESNMARVHGGEKPPFAELLDGKYHNSFLWIELPQDGGRSLGKVNRYAILEIATEDAKEIVLPPDARWFQLEEISEALFKGDVNEHLSQALALERFLIS